MLDEKQIAGRPRKIGKIGDSAVYHIRTKGGYHYVTKSDKIIGVGSHAGIARFLAEKQEPDVEWTELSKSDHLAYSDFQHVLPEFEALLAQIQEMQKAEQPLHTSVEGFMQGLRALPKEGPARGKFITQHMNHAPFLSALKTHPQGAQVHKMLTTHLNSVANAGVKPGATKVSVK